MAVKLQLLPPPEGLFFDEATHRYTFHSPRLGVLPLYSCSQVMEATEAKAMNWSHWRKRLMTKGLTKPEAEAAGRLWPAGPLSLEQANCFMELWRNHRAQVGTDFHALAQTNLLAQTMVGERFIEPEAYQMVIHWCKSFLPRVTEVFLIEQPLLHLSCFFSGTPDLLAVIDGILTLVDWKTQMLKYSPAGAPLAPKVRPEWQMQQGAYAEMIHSCYGMRPERGLNWIGWAEGSKDHFWNAADLEQGWFKFAGFLMELHAREARLGSIPHSIAMQAMAPMFNG
jgi:hypothetical protein